MQLLNLALLAVGASAVAIEERTTKPAWQVTQFYASHIVNSIESTTSFTIHLPGLKTTCYIGADSSDNDSLAYFTDQPCRNKSVTVGQEPVDAAGNIWQLTVTWRGMNRYAYGNTSRFADPEDPGDPNRYQVWDMPVAFQLNQGTSQS